MCLFFGFVTSRFIFRLIQISINNWASFKSIKIRIASDFNLFDPDAYDEGNWDEDYALFENNEDEKHIKELDKKISELENQVNELKQLRKKHIVNYPELIFLYNN